MAQQQPLQFTYNTDTNFASFHAGCNQELVQQLQLGASGNGEQQIFIWGQLGQGKSHLLQACCHVAHNHQQSHFYLALAQTQTTNPDILSGLENTRLVCIDDIQTIAGNTEWEQAFFRFYNLHREQGNHLIIASSEAPAKLNIALPDLKTRLTWGLCLKINVMNDEQRIAALAMKAKTMGLEITPRTGQFLLSRCTRDLPSLWTLLEKIDYATLAAQRKPTIPLIKEILKQN
jgi:DnaA family protein